MLWSPHSWHGQRCRGYSETWSLLRRWKSQALSGLHYSNPVGKNKFMTVFFCIYINCKHTIIQVKKNAFPHPLKIKYNWALIRHAIWQGVKKKYADILARKCGKCVSYAKNTLDYAEISTADKIDNDIRTTVKRKALQSLTHKLSSSPTFICGICWQVFIHLHSFSRAFLTHFVYRIHCCVRGTSVA